MQSDSVTLAAEPAGQFENLVPGDRKVAEAIAGPNGAARTKAVMSRSA
jgi:hypothetical protein